MTRSSRTMASIDSTPSLLSSEPIVVSIASQAIPEYLASEGVVDAVLAEDPARQPAPVPLFATSLGGNSARKFNKSPHISQLSLPTCFNLKSKTQYAELEPGNLQVAYSGQGKGAEIDTATVRGNAAIPPGCGIYYYEIKVVNKGRDGYIGVGFTTTASSQPRLPGYEEHSWGYHASDGKNLWSPILNGFGSDSDPGDIIGCCINFADLSISFTRNGIMLGVAYKGLKALEESPVYPIVGLRTPNEVVQANFGLQPFKFDIAQFYRDEKARIWRSVQALKLSPDQTPSPSTMNLLVVEYLVRQGYHKSALALYNSSIKQANELDETGQTFEQLDGSQGIEQRNQILCLIREGKVLDAIELIKQLYPTFATHFRLIHAQLLCLWFVEIIRSITPPPVPDSMQVDDSAMELEAPVGGSLLDAIQLSQQLKADYSDFPAFQDAVDEIIGLVCYKNAHDSPLAYVLDLSHRSRVADIVNSALLCKATVFSLALALQGCPAMSPLEKLFRHVWVLDELMNELASGSRTLLDWKSFAKE
ncbi:Ran-binding protein 9 [Kappamyces sp. JEL0680]|nr:Ran-binding protein 9 [Kappamyces sp. JEL0680]